MCQHSYETVCGQSYTNIDELEHPACVAMAMSPYMKATGKLMDNKNYHE